MLAKKLGLLVLLLLVLVSLSVSTRTVRACSGDDCNCNEYAQKCRDSCDGNFACLRACTREALICARECCSF
jgi:hypothetical protein